MKKRRITTINFRTSFIFAVLFGIVSTLTVSAQYGNLLSKQAADALAAGDSDPCVEEMNKLVKLNFNNLAAHVERSRCYFLNIVDGSIVRKFTKDSIAKGMTEAAAKKDAENQASLLLWSLRPLLDYPLGKNYSPAYNLRGAINKLDGKRAEALADFNRAIELDLDTKNFRAFANRGKLKDEMGDTAGAIADYEKVVALGINDPFITKRLPELKQNPNAGSQASQSNQQNAPEVYEYPNDKDFFGVPREKINIFLSAAVSNSYQDCTPYYSDFIVSQKMERPGRTPATRIIKREGSKPLMVVIAVGNELTSIKLTPWNGGVRTQIFNASDGKGIGWNFWAMQNAPEARPGLRFTAIEIYDSSVDYTAEAVRNDDNYTYISRFLCTAKK